MGEPVAIPEAGEDGHDDGAGGPGGSGHSVVNPCKLLRLASMLGAGLEEARVSEDRAAMARAASVLSMTVVEAGSAVSDDLLGELGALFARPADGVTEREREVVTAQLLGWLLGTLADSSAWRAAAGDPTELAAG